MERSINHPVANNSNDVPSRGLMQAEAERLLVQGVYNELVEEETNPALKFLLYLLGPKSVDDRSHCTAFRTGAPLASFDHHNLIMLVVNAIVGF